MAVAKRVSDEPAFVLHSYDWSESSLILEVFCRQQGRTALVAKGAKKPSSNFRPVLLPLQPLLVTYTLTGDVHADIHTLKGAEWVGGHVMPTGDALLSGMYLNELLLRLLARADPHPALFDAYCSNRDNRRGKCLSIVFFGYTKRQRTKPFRHRRTVGLVHRFVWRCCCWNRCKYYY